MAALTISENDGQAVYAVGNTPSTGPFAIDFPYFANDEVVVTKTVYGVDAVLEQGVHYLISGLAADDGYASGSITLLTGVSNCAITISRKLEISKSANFLKTGPLQISTLNTYFSRLFSIAQDLRRRIAEMETEVASFVTTYGPATTGLVATGASQATALPIGVGTNVFTTVGVGTGALLTDMTEGMACLVANEGLNPLSVYPPSGQSILPLAADVAMTVNVGDTLSFICMGDGTFLAAPRSLSVVSPLYFDGRDLKFDSDVAAINMLGSVPALNTDLSGLITLNAGTPGDWSAVINYSGSYVSQVGNIATVFVNVSGTATFTTASGNLIITGFPFTVKSNNQHLSLSGLTGFSGFAAPPTVAGEPAGFYGRFTGTQITMGFNRLNAASSAITVANITSGTPFSFTLTGALLVQ